MLNLNLYLKKMTVKKNTNKEERKRSAQNRMINGNETDSNQQNTLYHINKANFTYTTPCDDLSQNKITAASPENSEYQVKR